MSWFGALVGCERRGLRLATVESEEEQEYVFKLINETRGTVLSIRTISVISTNVSNFHNVKNTVW